MAFITLSVGGTCERLCTINLLNLSFVFCDLYSIKGIKTCSKACLCCRILQNGYFDCLGLKREGQTPAVGEKTDEILTVLWGSASSWGTGGSSGAQEHFWAVPLPVWAGVHWEKKAQLSFSPMGKCLIDRWVGRKWALENPLCFLARCLPAPAVWAVQELIYNLPGKPGNVTKTALPTATGETGSNKGNKSLLGVTFGHTALQMHRQLGQGFFSFRLLSRQELQLWLSTREYPKVGEAQKCSCHAWEGS